MFCLSDTVTHYSFTGENNEDTEFLYYMNEGVYGPFSRKLVGNSITAPSVHKVSRPPSQPHSRLNGAAQIVLGKVG